MPIVHGRTIILPTMNKSRELAAGEILFSAGEPATFIHRLLGGEIELTLPSGGIFPVPPRPDEFFGIAEVLAGVPRLLTARVTRAAHVENWAQNELQTLVRHEHDGLLRPVLRLSAELREYNERLLASLPPRPLAWSTRTARRLHSRWGRRHAWLRQLVQPWLLGGLAPAAAAAAAPPSPAPDGRKTYPPLHVIEPRALHESLLERFGRRYDCGAIIFWEGDISLECYLIYTGQVAIVTSDDRGERLLAMLGPGDVFGEMSLLEGRPRNASAIAATPLRLLAIHQTGLNALINEHPDFGFSLCRLLAFRVTETAGRLATG